jgi:hypothetical protein
MWKKSLVNRVPVQFFNETFFRPKTVLKLDPQNFATQFAKLPSDAVLIRRHRTKFYICKDHQVIGIYSPMMCLPLPVHSPPGGLTLGDYKAVLAEQNGVLLVVTTKASTLMVVLDKHGQPMAGPKVFVALPDEFTSIRALPSEAPYYQDVFGFLTDNYPLIDRCSTFWLKKGDDSMWSRLLSQRRGAYENCPVNLDSDPRWLPTTGFMYFPKLYNFKTREIDVEGALNMMRDGEIALSE